MSRWDEDIRRRLAGANLEPAREAEIARELAQHLTDRYAELRAAGLDPEVARLRTLDELKEEALMRRELARVAQPAIDRVVLGEARRQSLFAGAWQDVRYATRTLIASRGFTVVAVLTLALGIGATTAVFSAIDAMLIRPLAYDPLGRLVRVYETEMSERQWAQRTGGMVPSIQIFNEWQARNQVFDRMALWRSRELTLLDASPVERKSAIAVTPDFFRLFDAAPVVGRTFTDADVHEPVTIISYGCWQRRFGGDPNVLGRTVRAQEGSRTIVGVLAPEFPYSPATDFWIPLLPAPLMVASHGWGGVLLARLNADVTLAQARQNMDGVVRQLAGEGAMGPKAGVTMETLHEFAVGSSRQMLFLILGAVGCILLIACVNVAGLLVARGAGRTREVAIRASLGASRVRLLRQLLTESIVLAMLGGIAGIALAWWTLGAIVPMLPVRVPTDMLPAVDLRVLSFALLISFVTGLLFGLFPALRLSCGDFATAVKEGGDRATGWRGRTSTLLVTAEVALALILLVGAGLMVRSFQRLIAVDPGFQPDRVLILEAFPTMLGDGQVERARTFYAQLFERLEAIPGVEAVGAIDTLPFWTTSYSSAQLEGRESRGVSISPRRITPGYFQTIGVPVTLGRDFTTVDREGAPCVAIVNQTMARQHWPESGPLGQRLRLNAKSDWCDIVGVVGDVRHRSLERDVLPELYLSALQSSEVELTVVVRAQNPSALVVAARAQMSGLPEPTLVERIIPFDSLVERSILERRRRASLLSLVGTLGLLLASVGIFGLTSYSVARRTPEIGIRIALGATPARVLQTIIGSFAPAIAAGIAVGLFGAWAATRLVAEYMFGVQPTDPATLATACALLSSVALLACYLPARRALRIDPVVALRAE